MSKSKMVVVCMLLEQDGKILFGKRMGYDDGFNGMYCAPGGKCNADETLKDAVIREVEEETGLDLLPRDVYEIGYTEPPGMVIFFYWCRRWLGTVQNTEPEKCERWEWFPWNDWPDNRTPGLVVDFDRLYHQLKTVRGLYGKVHGIRH